MEFPIQDNTAGEETYKTPERRSVEALLDISEENFLTELEPHEYHCYSGWEEAVCGWARVAPLSCILVTQKTYIKSKHKEADILSPFDPTPSGADNTTSHVEQSCGSHVSLHNLKKSMSSQTGFWSQTAVAVQKPDTAERSFLNAIHRNTAHLSLEEKIKMEGTLQGTTLQPYHVTSKYSVPESRAAKPQINSPRPSNTVVSIKNLTFLPPIKSPHLNPRDGAHLCRGKKAPKGEAQQVKYFMLDMKSGTNTRKRVDALSNSDLHYLSPPMDSKYQSCQLNPHMSAVSVSVPRKFQTPMSPKPDIVHQNGYSMGKGFSRAIAQAHMHPSCLFS